ncbi:hypothetical protein RRG08_045468 [Elysia crispata]|uniref:Uncharacterized protein n=1 Tax=Elysia crispata TaxID=231223 RepID=A0AAE1AF36_9GAST|nr:hypothetical protein RRG08_045468 [Elysia crispata]
MNVSETDAFQGLTVTDPQKCPSAVVFILNLLQCPVPESVWWEPAWLGWQPSKSVSTSVWIQSAMSSTLTSEGYGPVTGTGRQATRHARGII